MALLPNAGTGGEYVVGKLSNGCTCQIRWDPESYSIQLQHVLCKADYVQLIERLNDIYSRHRPERYMKWMIVLFSFWMTVISPLILFFILGNVEGAKSVWDDRTQTYHYMKQPPIKGLNIAGGVLAAVTIASFFFAWRLMRLRKKLYELTKIERTAVLREFNEAGAPRGVNAVLRNKQFGQNGQSDLYQNLYIEWAAGVSVSYGSQYQQVAYGIPTMPQAGIPLVQPFSQQPAEKTV
jgi:hypothetical protein